MSISFNTVPANAAASAVFIESENVASSSGNKTIPQKVLLAGTFNAAFKPEPGVVKQIVTLNQARSLYGRGSLLASMAEAFFTNNSGTELYALPLSDADGTAASGTISVQDAKNRQKAQTFVEDLTQTVEGGAEAIQTEPQVSTSEQPARKSFSEVIGHYAGRKI